MFEKKDCWMRMNGNLQEYLNAENARPNNSLLVLQFSLSLSLSIYIYIYIYIHIYMEQ